MTSDICASRDDAQGHIFDRFGGDCVFCGASDDRDDSRYRPARRLTRSERLQGLADNGIDTWEDYNCER